MPNFPFQSIIHSILSRALHIISIPNRHSIIYLTNDLVKLLLNLQDPKPRAHYPQVAFPEVPYQVSVPQHLVAISIHC